MTNISAESINGISHSGFYVEDLTRTAEFYTKTIGARLAWRNDNSKTPLMKMYVGDFGLSILKWPDDVPRISIPFAIHWAYRVDPQRAEETIAYVRSLGIEVEGPVGHKREPGILNWFFLDPDNYRVEIEARFPNPEDAEKCLERNKEHRHAEMGLYAGDAELKKL